MHNYKDWENFCNYLINENRYILNDEYEKLTEEILKLAKDCEISLQQNSEFWRAKTSKELKVTEWVIITPNNLIERIFSAASRVQKPLILNVVMPII